MKKLRIRDRLRLLNPIPYTLMIGVYLTYQILGPIWDGLSGLLVNIGLLLATLCSARILLRYHFLTMAVIHKFEERGEDIKDDEARMESLIFLLHEEAYNSKAFFKIERELCLSMVEMYHPELKPLPQEEQDWGGEG